jgi:hypothetical protein
LHATLNFYNHLTVSKFIFSIGIFTVYPPLFDSILFYYYYK